MQCVNQCPEKTIIQFNFFLQVAPNAAKGRTGEDEQPIYFASLNSPPSSERRLVSQEWWFVEILINFFQFLIDTLIIFAAFRNLLKNAPAQEPGW
jgi:nuclear pore complex protein Nup85